MPSNSTQAARLLTYAGILPFAIGLAGQVFAPTAAPWQQWTAAYGAVIAAFIAGIHWAVHLFFGERAPINLLLRAMCWLWRPGARCCCRQAPARSVY